MEYNTFRFCLQLSYPSFLLRFLVLIRGAICDAHRSRSVKQPSSARTHEHTGARELLNNQTTAVKPLGRSGTHSPNNLNHTLGRGHQKRWSLPLFFLSFKGCGGTKASEEAEQAKYCCEQEREKKNSLQVIYLKKTKNKKQKRK